MTEGDAPRADAGMSAALAGVAESAEETAREQRRLAHRARTMLRLRRSGLTWSRILETEAQPGTLELLARSARRITDTMSGFRAALARALADEGVSIRRIAKHFGVSHQRISTMLNGRSS